MPTEKCVLDPERDCVSLERVEALEYQFREQREKSSATHKEFYNRIRELEKQNSVRDVQYKVYQVADAVGYTDPRHFAKVFKAATGKTPLAYRNTAR